MSSVLKIRAPMVIVGGGVLGLWLFKLAHQAGIKALLLEKNALVSSQSIGSQGMIHGGQRYNLLGKISKHAEIISKVREYWSDCFSGNGEIDLTQTQMLSDFQYLIRTQGTLNDLKMGFAKLWMKQRMKDLDLKEIPDWLRNEKYQFYRLSEPVIKVDTLARDLTHQLNNYIIKTDIEEIKIKSITTKNSNKSEIKKLICSSAGEKIEIKADHYCFAAGLGNAELIEKMNLNWQNFMQIRPLRQFILFDTTHSFFGHLLGLGGVDPRPSLSITTHPISSIKAKKSCWYIGGKVATDSLDMNQTRAIDLVRERLASAFSANKLDFLNNRIECFDINRAEPITKDFILPDKIKPTEIFNNTSMLWAVKLTLAPLIAQNVLKNLINKIQFSAFKKSERNLTELLKKTKRVEIAKYPWDD